MSKKIKKLTCWLAINRHGVVCGHRRRDFLVCDAFKQLFGISWYDKIMAPDKWLGKTEGDNIETSSVLYWMLLPAVPEGHENDR